MELFVIVRFMTTLALLLALFLSVYLLVALLFPEAF